MNSGPAAISDAQVLAARPVKNRVDPWQPYAFLVEPEHSAAGQLVDVATIFLTNRECPLRCTMCDLWKNTTDKTVPSGVIPAQIDYAMARLSPARHLKLYNSGNFFDPRAIPPEDYPAIAERARGFENVVVENHPRWCTDKCRRFQDLIETQLEVAIGLETVHPEVLPRLNKRMSLADFDRAVSFLRGGGIAVRAFILLRPPWLDEDEGVLWALRSIEYAFAVGVGCCSIIPTRGGNGLMEQLAQRDEFSPPRLESLEEALEAGLARKQGRVFADLWEVDQLAACPSCQMSRIERLRQMNLTQTVPPPVTCECEGSAG
jgi:archaeosine synthase beta-subunit